ncbi:MAG: hypothetical protein DRP79_06235, partial [Planctomycetota bacterium]
MIFKRKLGLTELEQRIAPAHTVTLDAVTTWFSFTDTDGDHVHVERDNTAPLGTIDITDDDATGIGDFDEIDSIVFNNDGCDATTTLDAYVSVDGGDKIVEVGYIDFTGPAAIGSIEVEGNILGAAGRASIDGSTIDSLIIRAADTDATAGGNIAAAANQIGIVLSSGLASSIQVDGAITGGNESGIEITGEIAGTITVGDMTDKTIDQYDNGGDEGINGATITITGNTDQGLAGNLGGIHTDGTIIDTAINIEGDFDSSNLTSSNDVISTDWDDNGVGTITNTTVTMTGGGDINGVISNNEDIEGGYWPVGPALPVTSDLDIDIVTNGGDIVNSLVLVSGGSLTGTIDLRDPGMVDDGDIGGAILAFGDIGGVNPGDFTVWAGDLTYGADTADFISDAEDLVDLNYFGDADTIVSDDVGTINNLVVNVSGDVPFGSVFYNDYDGNNIVSGDLVASVVEFGATPSGFAGDVVSGGGMDFTLAINGTYDGILSSFGDMALNFTAGNVAGVAGGYIVAGDDAASVTGDLTGTIFLDATISGNGSAVNFDITAFNILTSFDIDGGVDQTTQWAASVDFMPAAPGVDIGGSFDGQISADNDIKFDDTTAFTIGGAAGFGANASLTADADIDGTGNIDFDPASFETTEFDGAWSGAGILFTGSTFHVTGDMSGTITSTVGDITFVDDAGTPSSFAVDGTINTTGNALDSANDILFTNSDLDVGGIADGAVINAANDFIFDGDDTTGNTFSFGTFGGSLIAGGVITIQDTDGVTSLFDVFEDTGVIQAAGDISFNTGMVTITEFGGTIESTAGSLLFTDFDFHVDNFKDTGLWQADVNITWDPSTFTGDFFSGTWTAVTGDITFDNSTFTVNDVMSGTVQALAGDIIFQNSSTLVIESFNEFGRFLANSDFTFADSDFTIEYFEGDIIATVDDITFDNGTFNFGEFVAGAHVEATAGDVLFGDDDASNDTFTASVFGGDIVGDTISFTEMDLDFGFYTSDGSLTATTALVFTDDTSFSATQYDGTLSAPTLTLDHVDFDFTEFTQNGSIESAGALFFDGGSFTAAVFDGTLKGTTVTFGSDGDGVTADFGDFGAHGLIES